MNGNGGNGQRITQQTSFRTSLLSIASALTGLVTYLITKYFGQDPQLAALLAALFNTVAVTAAGWGSLVAERASKQQTQVIAANTATVVAEAVASPIAAQTAADVVRGEDV